MANRPEAAEWADVGADITDPPAGKKQVGWIKNESPGHDIFNWWMNTVYKWFQWLVGTAPPDVGQAVGPWTQRSSFGGGAGIFFFSAAFAPTLNRLCAVGADTTHVYTSDDGGITWTQRTSNAGTNQLYDVLWSGTQFVAVGGGGAIVTSPDGVTWTLRTSGTAHNLTSVAYNGTNYVAAGQQSTVLSSPDGVTWTARTTGLTSQILPTAVVWGAGPGVFLAVAEDASSTADELATSPDGVTWTLRTAPATSILPFAGYAAFNTPLFFIQTASNIYTSPDGITWTNAGAAPTGTMGAWFFTPMGVMLNFGTAAGQLLVWTLDGVTFTSSAPPFVGQMLAGSSAIQCKAPMCSAWGGIFSAPYASGISNSYAYLSQLYT